MTDHLFECFGYCPRDGGIEVVAVCDCGAMYGRTFTNGETLGEAQDAMSRELAKEHLVPMWEEGK